MFIVEMKRELLGETRALREELQQLLILCVQLHSRRRAPSRLALVCAGSLLQRLVSAISSTEGPRDFGPQWAQNLAWRL